ncbi:MAG TPA: amidohydrolase family protein [Streptosporangiaceae bacterium]
MNAESALVLINSRGTPGPVRIVGDRVAAVGPSAEAEPGDEVLDLTGYVLLPGLAEPHVHLDKAFTASRADRAGARADKAGGDLTAAIAAWSALRESLTPADFADRARRAALAYLASGTFAIRAHTDVSPAIGTTALAAIREVRDELAGVVDIDIVAMAGTPLTGRAGRENTAVLRDAIGAGADVIGGAPWRDPDPRAACELLISLAADGNLPVDVHVDETTDPAARTLDDLAALAGRGFPYPVTASHAVSLGSRPPDAQRRTAAAVAEAGVSVVTAPQTNLWLQDRDAGAAARRGLTAVAVLRAAGVTVAAGADNIRDPFNPLGRPDPLETAALLAAAAQLPPTQALTAVTGAAWAVLGRPGPRIQPGAPAAMVAVAAADEADAVAGAPPDRFVIRGSRVVARTGLTRDYDLSAITNRTRPY